MLYDPGADAQTIGNQIVVLPNGTLVNLATVITANSSQTPKATLEVLLSRDQGASWSGPFLVAVVSVHGILEPKNGRALRTGDIVPAIAVDATSGELYVVWEDARFNTPAVDGIAVSQSTNGGLNWSPAVQVNQARGSAAFTPTASVAPSGKLGVLYYDLRNDQPSDPDRLLATAWLATSSDGGATFGEEPLAPPFDLRTAPFAKGYFLGDYQGLVHDGESFLPFFAMTDPLAGGHAQVFFRPAGVAARPAAPEEVFAVSASALLRTLPGITSARERGARTAN